MNPSIYTAPLSDRTVDDLVEMDGVLDSLPTLDLDLSDEYIVKNLNGRINDSIDYWNELNGFNLKDQRIKNLKAFKGSPMRRDMLYYNETEWNDNEIFVGVDSMVSYVTADTPKCEVYPANKSIESKMLAADLEKYELAHSKKFKLAKKLEFATLNLLLQHVGIIGLEWDPDYGKNGEIIPRVKNPSHVIVDKYVQWGENPQFIAEIKKDSIEGVISKFPDKEKEILQLFSTKKKEHPDVTREIAYRQVCFTYYDDNHKPCEAVAWYVNKLVLDKKKDPNWLYDNEGENFLDNPMKPYVFFNLVNDGEHAIDLTGPVAQAIPMQDNLNIKGQQISDNLISANGSRVIEEKTMTTDQMQEWDQKPNQTVAMKVPAGKSLSDVVMELAPHTVSNELVMDVKNSRDALHGILSTPSQMRGDDNANDNTASESKMIKDQASMRQDKIIRALDTGMDDYYNLLTQLILVHYTDKHMRTINGGDGNFDHIEMHKDKVEVGMTVCAQPGSTLAPDKVRQEAVAQNAAELGFLAPYDYFRLMHMDQPQKLYDNLVKFKSDPSQLAREVGNEEEDKDAIYDFTRLMDGEKVEQREDVTNAYIEQFRKKMITDAFFKAKSSVRSAIIKFVDKAYSSLEVRTEIDELTKQEEEQPTQVPLPQAVQATIPPQPQMPMMPTPMNGTPMQPMQPPMPQMGAPMAPPVQAPQGMQGVMQLAQQPAGNTPPTLNPGQPQPPQPGSLASF
jgi:hypothetical protein